MAANGRNSASGDAFALALTFIVVCLNTAVVSADNSGDDNASCSATASSDIPKFISNGGFLLLIAAVIISLWALALVCEEFFVPALQVLCIKWKVPDSVAGSLIMAAGNNAPELFVSFLGIFVQKSAIGIGTVFGSEIFNHMCISAGSGYFAKGGSLQLNKYQFSRDCFAYLVALLVFMASCGAKFENALSPSEWDACLQITLITSSLLVGFQLLYCVLVAKFLDILNFLGVEEEDVRATIRLTIGDLGTQRPTITGFRSSLNAKLLDKAVGSSSAGGARGSLSQQSKLQRAHAPRVSELGGVKEDEEEGAFDAHLDAYTLQSDKIEAATAGAGGSGSGGVEWEEELMHMTNANRDTITLFNDLTEEEKGLAGLGLMDMGLATLSTVGTAVVYPLKVVIEWTVPDVRHDGLEGYYGIAILCCIVWLAVFAYALCECLTILGEWLHIPAIIMGLTFSAIGTSFPNLWCSLVVAKNGQGDMAVSNALGSNTFNILVALGLPWLCYNVINDGKSYDSLQDDGIVYLSVMLITVLVLYYLVIMAYNWKIHAW